MANATRTRNGSAPERVTAEQETPSAPVAPEQESSAPESAPETPSAPVSAPSAEQETPSAPESAPEQETPSAETPSAGALDISAAVETATDVKRRVRVFVEVSERAPIADASNRYASVQRERFANGDLGPFQLCVITVGKDHAPSDAPTPSGRVENHSRQDAEALQAQVDALAKVGVYVIRDRRPSA